jgi:abortive infection bacteriophage resistance protein
MSVPYEKKHLTYEAQIDKLVECGLQVYDRAVAAATLSHIGHYRLAGYPHTWTPKLPIGPVNFPGFTAILRSKTNVLPLGVEPRLRRF